MRIWVTGIGVVSPLGRGAAATMDALLAGTCAIQPVSLFDPSGCRSQLAAEVQQLAVAEVAPDGRAEGWSRTDVMATLAADEALSQSGIEEQVVDLIIGGTTAGMFETEDLLAQMYRDPTARRPLERMLSHPLSATADRMQQAVRPFRRARTVCSACSSGANALLLAAAWLRTGRSDRVLAGGADGLCRLTYTGFSCLGAVSAEACRPFDRGRSGLTIGEGAAFLLLETERAASARGAEPIAELRGWAVGAEAHHITNPQPGGETAAAVMDAALARAELGPQDIDYVNAHGTATLLNDRMEAAALRQCFGSDVEDVAVSSCKGQVGHTLGAAGAIEAAVTAMAVARDAMPPTVGLSDVDPECELDHVLEARSAPVRAAMSNSFGFGGSDAVLVLCKPGCFPAATAPDRHRVFVTAAATIGRLGLRGTTDAAAYLRSDEDRGEEMAPFDLAAHLDLGRARRIDRAGRLCAATMQAALRSTGSHPDASTLKRTGAIVGAAFGAVDACAAFVHRVYEKGPRFASPAVFPNLLPSSPAAHASIYLGLGGPVLSTADLGATAEGAMVTAAELISAGEAEMMLAGGVEEASPITEAVLGPLCSPASSAFERGEGTAVVLLEAEPALARRGAVAAAELTWWASWRGAPAAALETVAPPQGRAAVVLARADEACEALLSGGPWSGVPRRSSVPHAGAHECAGGFAVAAALSSLATGELDTVLALGSAPDRGYAMVLVARSRGGA